MAFAKTLADRLTATGRYDVFLTRTDDTFVTLGDRDTEDMTKLIAAMHPTTSTKPVRRIGTSLARI
jgi:hypothetical protein